MDRKKTRNQVWLLRTAYDRLEQAKDASGKTFAEIGVNRTTFHEWGKHLADGAEKHPVAVELLVRFCRGVGVNPEDLSWDNETDRQRVRAALAELGGEVDTGWEVAGAHRLPDNPPDRLFGPAAGLIGEIDRAFRQGHARVVTVCGRSWSVGGVGKTSVVNAWFRRLTGRAGGGRVFLWSFNDQNHADEPHSSADEFLETALHWYGDDNPSEGTGESKAVRLADRLCRLPARPVLILDGLEPLQGPPDGGRVGSLRHRALKSLFTILVSPRQGFNGFCVITSRLPVADLAAFEGDGKGHTARRLYLDNLSDEAGCEFLRSLGVTGSADRLKALSREFNGHPLALRLLGTHAQKTGRRDVASAERITNLNEAARRLRKENDPEAERFFQAMARCAGYYEGKPESRLLRVVSLFDGPASEEAIEAVVRASPPVDQLTDLLHDHDRASCRRMAEDLRDGGLLQVTDAWDYDLHSSVRAYLTDDFRRRWPNAWRDGHRRIRDYFAQPRGEEAPSLARLKPLYRAVAHGCRAGDLSRAFREDYWRGIAQPDPATGEGRFPALQQLCCYDEELRALAHFFERPWEALRPELRDDPLVRGLVEGLVGFCLRARGELGESLTRMESSQRTLAGVDAAVAKSSACRVGGYRAETLRTLGELTAARRVAGECVDVADQLNHPTQRVYQRTTLADILHWQNALGEAGREFEAAAAAAGGALISIPSVRLCEFLLTRKEYGRAARQAEAALKEPDGHFLAECLHNLYLWYARYHLDGGGAHRTAGLAQVDAAVRNLRCAHIEEHLSLGLLVQGRLLCEAREFDRARAVLEEGLEISRSCSARLTEADCQLELVRLRLEPPRGSASLGEARTRLDATRELVHGEYWLREGAWHELDDSLTALGYPGRQNP